MNNGPSVLPVVQEPTWWQSCVVWFHTHVGTGGVLVEGIAAGVIGFFIGFFLSRHGRYFFVMIILFIVVLGVLLSSGLLNIEWNEVRQLTGIDLASTVVDVARQIRNFFAAHRGISIGALIGILLGYLSS